MAQSAGKSSAKRISFAEYVERELQADFKSEYHGGEVLAMSGGSIDHSRIIRNLARRLSERLQGKPCEPFESNLRTYVREYDRAFYPDAQVICGPIEYHDGDRNRTTVVNPSIIFEVLSPGALNYDRGDKMRAYLTIPSLKQYVLIESTTAYVELLTRRDDGWLRTDASGIEAGLYLEAIGIELKLSELYLGVTFPVLAPPPER